MNAKADPNAKASAGDIVKYLLAALAVAGGVVVFYSYPEWPGALRGLMVLLGLIAGAAIAAFTAKGRVAQEFIGEARFELRKVVWPTRQETLRSSGLIIVVVIIVAIMLSIIDYFLANGIGWLIG
jgi:preprotein translocase subunit SecE